MTAHTQLPDEAKTAKAIEEAADAIAKEMKKATGDAAMRLGTRLIRHGTQILRGRRLRAKGFEERLYSRWAYPLDMYEFCLYLATECGDYFSRHHGPQAGQTRDHKHEALKRLHAGACRIAGEIYKLLLSGFPSGAHARWRTMHETACVALFIANQPDEVAERYLLHRYVKSYEDAKFHQKHAARLGLEPFSDEEMANIKRNYQAVLTRFGNDFRFDYAWARPAVEALDSKVKGQIIGFQHIQTAVDVEQWTPHYRMASHAVHPSATFLRFTLGTREDEPVLLAGASNADLADPGQDALLALSNATAALMTYRPKARDDEQDHNGGDFSLKATLQEYEPILSVAAMALALHAFTKTAIEAFAEAQQQLDSEIEQERAAHATAGVTQKSSSSTAARPTARGQPPE